MRNLALILTLVAVSAAAAAAQDLAEGCTAARAIAARYLGGVKLVSIAGTETFKPSGQRKHALFLHFTGKAREGRRMVLSLNLLPDGSITGETSRNNFWPDSAELFRQPDLDVEALLPAEEAIDIALKAQAGYAPTEPISVSYERSSEFDGDPVIFLYWVSGDRVYTVAVDAQNGEVLQTGEGALPGTSAS